MLDLVQLGELARTQAAPALRRPAAARRRGPRADQPPQGAAPRRAPRRPRPQAAPPDAAGAQAHPDRGRHHLRPRHARPGGGHDDGRHRRGDERGPGRAARRARRPLREPAHHLRRQLPRHLQPHRGRGRLAGAATTSSSGGRRQAACCPPARCSAPTTTGGKVLVGVRPEKISLSARRRRGRDPRGPQPHHRAGSPTPASSASPPSTSSTARSAPNSRSTRRTSSATAGSSRAPRSSCTGTPRTPSASTRPRTSTPASRGTTAGCMTATATEAPPAAAPRHRRTKPPRASARKRLVPYWLLLPGMLWLIVFFALPMVYQASTSVQTGSLEERLQGHLALRDLLGRAPASTARSSCARCSTRAPPRCCAWCSATRWRTSSPSGRPLAQPDLVLVIAPFFTSFLIRTLAWKTILADGGPVVGALNTLHVLDVTSWLGWTAGDRVLATPLAVVCGLTYNFLPFMILPLYTSLERIDGRLHEAAGDLYATAVHHLPQGDLPAVDAGRRLRHPADLHPGERRLRQRRTARLHRHQHDRQRHPDAVPARARLSDGGGALLHPHGRDPGHGHLLHPPGPGRRIWSDAPSCTGSSAISWSSRGCSRSRTCSCRTSS